MVLATVSQPPHIMTYSVRLLLTFACLLVSTFATPVKRDGSYSKSFRQAVAPKLRNGVIELDRTFRKYGIASPQALSDAVTEQKNAIVGGTNAVTNEKVATGGGHGSGSVVANPMLHNSQYLSPVTIGGQTMNLDVDTGSSDLYVPFNFKERAGA